MVFLSGCAVNLSAVRTHADATAGITKAFEPMLDETIARCKARATRQQFYGAPVFDIARMEQVAKDQCDGLVTPNAAINEINSALALYAEKLSAIADDGVAGSLDGDITSLSKAVGNVKDRTGTAFVQADKLGAVTQLAQYLAKKILAKKQGEAIREALSHEAAVGTLADTLVLYAEHIYAWHLGQELERLSTFRSFVEQSKDSPNAIERLSARSFLLRLHEDEVALKTKRDAIPKFGAAVKKMKDSHHDLLQNLDQLDTDERRKNVLAFVKEVRDLGKTINKAF
jgi:hypothetical protein